MSFSDLFSPKNKTESNTPVENNSINDNKDKDITLFAQTNFRNRPVKFGIKRDDRRRHMYLIGKTGMGKSNCLENMVIDDIQKGHGVCLVDPHGDAAEKILKYIPDNRKDDVVYFNPADMDYPFAFNILEMADPAKKHLVASGLVGIFKKIWAESWGPRLEYVLRNTILALLDYPGSTLLGITRVLVDKGYRKKVVEEIKDPIVKAFWVDEYAKYPDRFQVEVIAPIQNKVGQFLSNAMIRNIIGQVHSTMNMRDIMDKKKILLVNLSKGRIGEDTSGLLGAMIITQLYLAAMERVDVEEEERKDFYLYVDEFQNFATESFADILSEARKYRLNLTLAHQYIEQLDETVASAIFGNVGSIVSFRVGAKDAEELAKEFAPEFTEEDLVNLTKYDVYLRLMIDGVASAPFSASTLPPISGLTGNREEVIELSREKYANSRDDVENAIREWTQVDELVRRSEQSEQSKGDTTFKKKPEFKPSQSRSSVRPQSVSSTQQPPRRQPSQNTDSEQVMVTCKQCGKKVRLNFTPDPSRPVYCRDCWESIKAARKNKTVSSSNPKVSSIESSSQHSHPISKNLHSTSPISSPEVKTEEQTSPPPKSISLTDALGQGAVTFSGKPIQPKPERVEKQPEIEKVEMSENKEKVNPPSSKTTGDKEEAKKVTEIPLPASNPSTQIKKPEDTNNKLSTNKSDSASERFFKPKMSPTESSFRHSNPISENLHQISPIASSKVKTEEQTSPPPKSISLTDALGQGAVTFSGKPIKHKPEIVDKQPPSEEVNPPSLQTTEDNGDVKKTTGIPLSSNNPLAQIKKQEENNDKPSINKSDSVSEHTLKEGGVIKF